jgi:hypothetical protein
VLVAALALTPVLKKSSVFGVCAPIWMELKMTCEFGLGAGNMEPPPPGVRPVLRPDSFGVGKLRE